MKGLENRFYHNSKHQKPPLFGEGLSAEKRKKGDPLGLQNAFSKPKTFPNVKGIPFD